MMSFGLGLLALVRPIQSVPRSSIESRTHAEVLTPGAHIIGVHWTIDGRPLRSPPQFTYMGWPPLSSDREAGEAG